VTPGGQRETVGLIAGNRTLPFLWARRARERGLRVAALGFREETDPRLAREVDAFEMVSLGELGKLLGFFKAQGVRRAVMQGQIQHKQIYKNIKADWRAKWLMAKQAMFVRDFRTEAILGAIARELDGHGVHLEPATWLMEPWLAPLGRLAGAKPVRALQRDIEFGVRLTRDLNRLDVGQTVVVKRQSCVAVESIEGTDACVLRAAKLAGPGCVVVKLARPKQDLRFDLPVVGPKTFKILARARAAALVLEAGKTLFLDKEACLAEAASAGMAVLAVTA
jgi:UDP-2,3-diacylglucosamine hydrolase